MFSLADFKLRRENLVNLVKQKFPEVKNGIILFFGNFEQEAIKFRQESSFYYFTGISEPGTAFSLNLDGTSNFYAANTGQSRAHWIANCIDPLTCKPADIGFDELNYLGEKIKGYEFYPFFDSEEYMNLISYLREVINKNGKIFTLNPQNQRQYFEQRFILNRINQFLPGFENSLIDISPIVAKMRRKKSQKEIEALYKVVDITILGQEAAIQVIESGKFENEVQAAIEYVFTVSNCELAFPSIVGSGKNSTILHYVANNKKMEKNDLVVVDIGAKFEHYCGDLTRTYPVSGKFSKRQREIYEIVLETQEYIADIARPGLWLSNKEKPDESLNHIAREFLKEKNYEKYFLHGIGHFLGLDVHDVGDYANPLEPGDVITIEPGIYISQENIGVRIEDNYWIVEDGVVCLSEHLPKSVDEIEKLMIK